MRLPAVVLLTALSLAAQTGFDAKQADRFAQFALDCVHKQYPNKIAHSLNSDADVKPPRELTPAFYGCYDWHSSVHGHWLLVRSLRLFPGGAFAPAARAALGQSLTPGNIAREVDYLVAEEVHHLLVAEEVHLQAQLLLDLVLLMHPYSLYN